MRPCTNLELAVQPSHQKSLDAKHPLKYVSCKLCRRVVQKVVRMESWSLAQQTLQRAMVSQDLTSETETSVERDEELWSTSSVSEKRKRELSVRKLHHICRSRFGLSVTLEKCQTSVGISPKTSLRCLRRGGTTRCETSVRISRESRNFGEWSDVPWPSGLSPRSEKRMCQRAHDPPKSSSLFVQNWDGLAPDAHSSSQRLGRVSHPAHQKVLN